MSYEVQLAVVQSAAIQSTHEASKTPSKISIIISTTFVPHLILQKDKYLYKNYYKISERHVGISLGKKDVNVLRAR